MRSLFALLLLAGPAAAQDWQPNWEVSADLDGNGAPERYRLVEGAEGNADLVVEGAGPERRVRGIAWRGGIGQQPEIGLNAAGSVVLTSMNEAIGRDRWRLTLTIAHRQGDWRVAGISYDSYDTLDMANWSRCDLNLLTGRGTVETEAGLREVEAPPAPLLWDWTETDPPVSFEVCFKGEGQ